MSDRDDHNVRPTPAQLGPVRQIDEIDRALIEALVADGRMSLTDLAQHVDIARSTAHARIQRLRDERIITGFTAVVDHAAIGLGVTALVFLDVDQHDWRALRDELAALPGVEHLAMCAGRFDLMMIVRVPTIADLRDVLLERIQRMAGVTSTETVLVLDEARPGRVGPS